VYGEGVYVRPLDIVKRKILSSPKKERGPHTKKAYKKKGIGPTTLAGRMRAARKATKKTVRQLAPLIPTSHATVSDIENAKTDPAVVTVRAILDTLRRLLGNRKYALFLPPDLDLQELKERGKITEQIIDYQLPPVEFLENSQGNLQENPAGQLPPNVVKLSSVHQTEPPASGSRLEPMVEYVDPHNKKRAQRQQVQKRRKRR
jgi:transcriptional regulator with XRE-family HTH domain